MTVVMTCHKAPLVDKTAKPALVSVLKTPVFPKWLSYRESKVLGRPLLPEEVQRFTDTGRRIGAILLLVSR